MKKIISIFIMLLTTVSLALPVFALNPVITSVPEYVYTNTDEYPSWCGDANRWVLLESLMDETVYEVIEAEYGWKYFNKSFFGERPATRCEVAVLMSRYNGSYDTIDFNVYDVSTCPTFVDVPDGQQYTPAAQWAYDNGIVNGVGGAYFAPERTITREEFAAMMYRYTNYLEADTSARADFDAFADGGSVSDWATDAMAWAVAEGLISGKPGNLLAPKDTITRAEVAVIIYRFNNEVVAHRDIWDGN